MNYLAHVFVSHATPAAITGAILGDFVKGRPPEHWNPEVTAAIRLHRAVDRYTDQHPAVAASRAQISPERRRFAGVLVDIFYDHFLARHWSHYHGRPLAEFTRSVYAVLLPQHARLPERLQRVLPRMAADDWLASYADVAAVQAALGGIARRFRYPERAQVLCTGAADLRRSYAVLEEHFSEFIPQLVAFARAYAEKASAPDSAAPGSREISATRRKSLGV